MSWEISPRNADLGRTLDPLSEWTKLDLVERCNAPDTWVLTGPTSELRVFTAGMGCILDSTWTDRHGVVQTKQITSGKMRVLNRQAAYDDDGRLQDTTTLGFIADTRRLWGRLCYPDPAHEITATPSTFAVAHDVRTGPREDIILDLIADHLGPAAPIADRRLEFPLELPVSAGRGGTTTKKLRMDVLGDVVAELAEQAGLRVRIVHDESAGAPRLLLVIDDRPDVSADVIFGSPDVANATAGTVSSFGYALQDPEVTDAIAWSAGEKTAREATRLSDPAAIALWRERVEVLVDQRQTDDVDDITDALTDRLAEGATPVSVEFTITPGADAEFRTDYDTGYRVAVELPDLPEQVSDNTIREVNTVVTPDDPEPAPAFVIGTPGAQSASTKTAARLNRALKRIAMLERSR